MALFRQEADRRFNIGQSEIEATLRGDIVPQAANEVSALQTTSETPEDEGLEGEGFGARYARVRSALSEFSPNEPVNAVGAAEKLRRDIISELNIGGGGGFLFTGDKNPWGETKEDKDRDAANDALGEMVELGREERKREWEKQVVRLGNFQISKGELARYGRELQDQKTYDAYEEYLIGIYGEQEGRRRAREFREYTYITNLQSEGAATPEQNARRSELETTRGSEIGESARAYQNWQNKFQPSAPRLQQGGVQTERGVSGSSTTQRSSAIELESLSVDKPHPISHSSDPLLENPIQAKSLRIDFIKVAGEQGMQPSVAAVMNPAPAKTAKWEATGLSV